MKKAFTPVRAKLPLPCRETQIEQEQEFLQRIAQECRRAERSKQRFVLVLIEGFEALQAEIPAITAPIGAITRETDAWGWYESQSTIGILFVELGGTPAESAQDTIVNKLRRVLIEVGHAEKLAMSVYILPRDLNKQVAFDKSPERISEYMEPLSSRGMKVQLGVKRAIDLAGSVLLLIILAPLMALIALAVRLGSPGPVLFRQTRVGQRGRPFTFLKFRSMTATNDPSLHKNYVTQFIKGTAPLNTDEKGEGVFKLTQDFTDHPAGKISAQDELGRITPVLERFARRDVAGRP